PGSGAGSPRRAEGGPAGGQGIPDRPAFPGGEVADPSGGHPPPPASGAKRHWRRNPSRSTIRAMTSGETCRRTRGSGSSRYWSSSAVTLSSIRPAEGSNLFHSSSLAFDRDGEASSCIVPSPGALHQPGLLATLRGQARSRHLSPSRSSSKLRESLREMGALVDRPGRLRSFPQSAPQEAARVCSPWRVRLPPLPLVPAEAPDGQERHQGGGSQHHSVAQVEWKPQGCAQEVVAQGVGQVGEGEEPAQVRHPAREG